MIIILFFVFWAGMAPSGYVIGAIASQHLGQEENEATVAWCAALLPPVNIMLAIYLMLTHIAQEED